MTVTAQLDETRHRPLRSRRDGGRAEQPRVLGSLSFALAVAFVAAVPVDRRLIARGKGHAAAHRTGIHGGPDLRLVGVIVAAFVFGTAVLIAEVRGDDDGRQVEMSSVLTHEVPA